MKSKLFFGCAMMVMIVACGQAQAGLRFSGLSLPKPQMVQTTTYLSNDNKALREALNLHNLIHAMPQTQVMVETAQGLKDQKKFLSESLEQLSECSSKKLGGVFKDPNSTWQKIQTAYENTRLQKETDIKFQKGDPLAKTSAQQFAEEKSSWMAGREIMMDVYQNPEKWGEIMQDESFPLWQDQVALYEEEWNQFYDQLNTSFGAPVKGRPAVSEEVRHNPNKYDEVLKAHQTYVASLQKNNSKKVSDLPPKAPNALPNWQTIATVDPVSKKVYPELPDPWKTETKRQTLLKVSPDGEMSQFFENGDTSKPTALALSGQKSGLEEEYELSLAIDALEQGANSITGTQNQVVQDFMKRLADAGIDTTNLDIAQRGDYGKIQKQLKDKKKQAIQRAYDYVNLLEKQESENPQIVAKRKKEQQRRQAKMSGLTKTALAEDMDSIMQIDQMSPVSQQRLVLSALEKDEDALVHLTETNALNVEQLMKESRAKNKLLSETQKQARAYINQAMEQKPTNVQCGP